MPPQQGDSFPAGDKKDMKDTTDDNGGESAAPVAAAAAAPEPDGGASYWEPDRDNSLKNKTLSTLDFATMESNHPEEKKQKNSNYWEAPVDKSLEGKTLSSVDLADLVGKNNTDTTATTDATIAPVAKKLSEMKLNPSAASKNPTKSYWDAPQESSLMNTTLSTLDISLLDTNNPEQQKEKTGNYWEAPVDKSLEGKTLSTLDMSMIDSNNPIEKQEKKESEWEAQPEKSIIGKTLSTLDMTTMDSNHPEEKKEQTDNYWEADKPEKNLSGRTLSTVALSSLEHQRHPSNNSLTLGNTNAPAAPAGASYWDDAPIDKSLEGKKLSALDLSAMEKQHVDKPQESRDSKSSSFWDWKVKELKKSVSKLSLSNLRTSSNSDRVDDNDITDEAGRESRDNRPGPITNKVHKLRNTWRKSFQRLSSNTLSQLDDSSHRGRSPFQRVFKSKNGLDISGGSRTSQASIGEDAIMF
jgi:hypothetical protein